MAVAESVLAADGLGARLELGDVDDVVAHLFGEGPGGFVLSGEREALLALADRIPLDIVGEVTADGGVSGSCGGAAFAVDRAALETAHDALARLFP